MPGLTSNSEPFNHHSRHPTVVRGAEETVSPPHSSASAPPQKFPDTWPGTRPVLSCPQSLGLAPSYPSGSAPSEAHHNPFSYFHGVPSHTIHTQ